MLHLHRNIRMPTKYPSLFHKNTNYVFTNADRSGYRALSKSSQVPGAVGRHSSSNGDTRNAWHIPGQLASAAALSPPNAITCSNFIYQKKNHFHSTKLMWPGVGARKKGGKSCPLFIYFNRTRQNSLLLEINIKPCRTSPLPKTHCSPPSLPPPPPLPPTL